MKYYTLLSRGSAQDPWVIEFGDFLRNTVNAEFRYFRDRDVPASNMKIISTEEDQNSINAAVRKLNGQDK